MRIQRRLKYKIYFMGRRDRNANPSFTNKSIGDSWNETGEYMTPVEKLN